MYYTYIKERSDGGRVLEKVKSRLHVRGRPCVFTDTHTLRRNRIAITTF